MKLSKLFGSTAPNKVFFAITLGSLAGFAYSLMIPLILLSLHYHPSRLMQEDASTPYLIFERYEVSTPKLALTFFLLCLFILICRATSQALLARLAIDVTKALRKNIYRRISQLPIQDLERIGPARLMAALTSDIPRVTSGAAMFPEMLVSTATLIGLLGFLIYLKIQVFFFIISIIFIGAITYQIPLYFGGKYMLKARNRFDYIHEGIRGLIYGAKELKINQLRQQSYLKENLDSIEDSLSSDEKRGQTFMIIGLNYGNLISFFAIGFVTYVIANYYNLSAEYLTGVVMVMLYIIGPISALINSVTPIKQASIALKKLQTLLNDMPIEAAWGTEGVIDCQEILLKNLTYTYKTSDAQERGFFVGPINLKLKRGEVTFLVGGNGSGKTTLAKLLSLHYIPQNGTIYFDQNPITNENREACRQSVSAIYTDFYLFTKLFGLNNNDMYQLTHKYISDLNLEGKVKITNGSFSGTDLSDGQRKRLALLVTYLENRSIYVFDEWAADQDPTFREIFYRKILPNLKNMNKLVIVISHDDRYFDAADKIVSMENGIIKNIEVKNSTFNEMCI